MLLGRVMTLAFVISFGATGVLLGASPAHGQARRRGTSSGETARRAQAVTLYEESAVQYRDGNFERAATLLEEAYGLYPQAVLLYNLARAYEGMGAHAQAIEAYERYLAAEPEADDRGGIEARLVTLRGLVAREHEVDTITVTPAAATTAPQDETPTALGVTLVTVGSIAVVVGGALAGVATVEHEHAVDPARTQVEALAAHDNAATLGTASIVLLAAGGVIGVSGGIVLLTLGASSTSASVRIAPTSLQIEGSF